MKMKKVLSLVFLALFLISCSSTPITGRKQLLLVNEEETIQNSYTQYAQVMKQSTVLNNNDAKLVKKVGNNIAKAMPGGKVAFYTGILPYTKGEQGIAVVMSHEIAHAIAEHSREQQSQSMVQGGVGAVLQVAFGVPQELYGSASNLVMLGYSRKQETEADELGLIFMKLAGYNPNYALTFWERMSSASGGKQSPEFLSTHPNDKTRIENIKKFLNSPTFLNVKK